MEEKLKLIFERRSCRGFSAEPISDEALHLLQRAGMYAPSVRNTKPWEFIVLRDEELKAKVAASNRNWAMLKDAPLGIIVGVKGHHESLAIHYQQECGASTENILLAAQGWASEQSGWGCIPMRNASALYAGCAACRRTCFRSR